MKKYIFSVLAYLSLSSLAFAANPGYFCENEDGDTLRILQSDTNTTKGTLIHDGHFSLLEFVKPELSSPAYPDGLSTVLVKSSGNFYEVRIEHGGFVPQTYAFVKLSKHRRLPTLDCKTLMPSQPPIHPELPPLAR